MLKIKRLSNNKGFTLVEAISSVFILGVGFFSLAVVFLQEFSAVNRLREMTIATLAAQQETEQIRNMPFDTIVQKGSGFAFDKNDVLCLQYLNNPAGAPGSVTLDRIYNNDDHIRKVSVIVTWKSRSGEILHKSLVTLITRNGIDKQ